MKKSWEPREFVRTIRAAGFEYHRPGKGSHDIYRNSTTNRTLSIPRTKVNRMLARRLLKEIGILEEVRAQ